MSERYDNVKILTRKKYWRIETEIRESAMEDETVDVDEVMEIIRNVLKYDPTSKTKKHNTKRNSLYKMLNEIINTE